MVLNMKYDPRVVGTLRAAFLEDLDKPKFNSGLYYDNSCEEDIRKKLISDMKKGLLVGNKQ